MKKNIYRKFRKVVHFYVIYTPIILLLLYMYLHCHIQSSLENRLLHNKTQESLTETRHIKDGPGSTFLCSHHHAIWLNHSQKSILVLDPPKKNTTHTHTRLWRRFSITHTKLRVLFCGVVDILLYIYISPFLFSEALVTPGFFAF